MFRFVSALILGAAIIIGVVITHTSAMAESRDPSTPATPVTCAGGERAGCVVVPSTPARTPEWRDPGVPATPTPPITPEPRDPSTPVTPGPSRTPEPRG